jgi:Aspartyl/asparaginyl beta-hydroxylase and related dioxygenases
MMSLKFDLLISCVLWSQFKSSEAFTGVSNGSFLRGRIQDGTGVLTVLCAKQKGGGKKTSSAGGSGFGAKSSSVATSSIAKKNKAARKAKGNLIATLNDEPSAKPESRKGVTYVKSEQEALLASLAATASVSPIGQAVANSPLHGSPDADPFYELMPSLIASKFPHITNDKLHRVAGFVKHALDPNLTLEDSIVQDPYRPHTEIHAYMPGLGETKPFYDPSELNLCRRLSENIDVIEKEYEALLSDMKGQGKKDRFQSVTSMNYESGWKTLVLFYNGHRIKDFPYHLCPVTTEIMESVPLAGRIAGFNRQKPNSGIPLHSDGNNMWLTCQMGIKIPENQKAYIRVGPETRRWKRGECLVYDTTYEHETMNESETEERVVLHVDFFNTLAMTREEIEIMRYIYSMREEFMKAEGVAKVGAQIL